MPVFRLRCFGHEPDGLCREGLVASTATGILGKRLPKIHEASGRQLLDLWTAFDMVGRS